MNHDRTKAMLREVVQHFGELALIQNDERKKKFYLTLMRQAQALLEDEIAHSTT